eukprot:1507347-Pyramimonas_sp.AAC.1
MKVTRPVRTSFRKRSAISYHHVLAWYIMKMKPIRDTASCSWPYKMQRTHPHMHQRSHRHHDHDAHQANVRASAVENDTLMYIGDVLRFVKPHRFLGAGHLPALLVLVLLPRNLGQRQQVMVLRALLMPLRPSNQHEDE